MTWTAPYDGGSAILSYSVEFLHKDGVTWKEDASVCDGSLLTLLCTIPSAYFTTSTNYNLLWGASVFARVAATNVRGTSLVSAAGNGAVIV